MAGSHFEVDADFSELFKALEGRRKQAENLSPVMQVIAEQLVAAVSDEFNSEGHGKWRKLADSTIAGRRGAADHKILQDTGALAGSQNPQWGNDFAEVSTDKFYAVFHVSDAPRKKIPLRNFYDLPEHVFDTALETLLRELVK